MNDNNVIDLVAAHDHTERLGSEAFSRLALGLSEKLDVRSALRRSTLAAIAFAWASRRVVVECTLADVRRIVDEAKALVQQHQEAVADQPHPLELEKRAARTRSEIADALRAAESNFIGLELALEDIAKALNFDANAARRLVGVTRWQSSNLDPAAVEQIRGKIFDVLSNLAARLQA